MPKFMQSLGIETYHRLLTEAKARDVTVQSLIRTVIVPEWLNTAPAMKPSIQTTIARPIAQPGTFISHAGILTETTRRPFLFPTLNDFARFLASSGSLAFEICSRRASITAVFATDAISAPVYPSVRRAISSRFTSSARGVFRV